MRPAAGIGSAGPLPVRSLHPAKSDKLRNKIAIVTGTASGIGTATAKLFACEGASIVALPIEAFASRLPTRRLVTPEEIAEAFLFLASSAARSITGQTLVIDGGFTAGDFGWVPMPRA